MDNYFDQYDEDEADGGALAVAPEQQPQNFFDQFDSDPDPLPGAPTSKKAAPVASAPVGPPALPEIPGVSFQMQDPELTGLLSELDRKNKREGTDAINKARGDGFIEGVTDPQQYAETVKGIPSGAVRFVGTTAKGASAVPYAAQLNAAGFGRKQIDIMDRIDRGEVVPDLEDVYGYQHMQPEQRQAIRADAERAAATFAPTPLAERRLFQTGQAISDYAKTILPPAPGYEDSIGRQLGEGLGSLVAGLPAGFLGRVPAAVFFGAGGSGEALERAIEFDKVERAAGRSGLTEEQKVTAALWGIAPGTTDLLPVEFLLGRLKIPAPLRNAFARAVTRIGGQAFVEGTQEGGQAFLQNLIAREVYNSDQGLTEGIAPEAALGAGVGGIAEAAKQVAGGVIRRFGGRRAPSASGAEPVVEPDLPPQTVEEAVQRLDAERQAIVDEAVTAPQEVAGAPVAPTAPEALEGEVLPPVASPEDADAAFDEALRQSTRERFDEYLAIEEQLASIPEDQAPPADLVNDLIDSEEALVESFRIAGLPGDSMETGAQPVNSAEDIKRAFERATDQEIEAYWLGRRVDALETQATQIAQSPEFAATVQNVGGLSAPQAQQVSQLIAERVPQILSERIPGIAAAVPQFEAVAKDVGRVVERMAKQPAGVEQIASRELPKLVEKYNLTPETGVALMDMFRGASVRGADPTIGDLLSDVAEIASRPESLVERLQGVIGEAATPANLRQSFANLIDSKTAQSKWAESLGVSEEDIAPLVDEAVEKGWLRRDAAGKIRRAPKTARVGNIAALAVADAAPDSVPGDGNVAKTDAAADRWDAIKAAVMKVAKRILPAQAYIDFADHIEIMRLRKEDELLALRVRDIVTSELAEIYDEFGVSNIDELRALKTQLPLDEKRLAKLSDEYDRMGEAEVDRLLAEQYGERWMDEYPDGLPVPFYDSTPRMKEIEAEFQALRDKYKTDDPHYVEVLADEIGPKLRRAEKLYAKVSRYSTSEALRISTRIDEITSEIARIQRLAVPKDEDKALLESLRSERKSLIAEWKALPEEVRAAKDLAADGMFSLRAFHGSPHNFDRFDSSRIGTGEGAQVFGHGLYFAENQLVARSYQNALSVDGITINGERIADDQDLTDLALVKLSDQDIDGRTIDDYERDVLEGIGRLKAMAEPTEADAARYFTTVEKMRQRGEQNLAAAQEYLEKVRLVKNGEVKSSGVLYEVDVDVEPDQLLDWDKPLSEQSASIKSAFEKLPKTKAEADAYTRVYGEEPTIGQLIRTFADIDHSAANWPAQTSRALREAGIPGIRYLDQGSRGAGEGSRNIVIFDDSLVKITKKNGEPVSAAERQSVVDEMFSLRGFYSPAIRAAESISQTKGTGEQFLKQITKIPGVRKDEIEWMGLEEFLKDKPSITKAEVLDFMRAHQVELDEKVLGDTLTSEKQLAEIAPEEALAKVQWSEDWFEQADKVWSYRIADEQYYITHGEEGWGIHTADGQVMEGDPSNLAQAQHMLDGQHASMHDDPGITKFADYKVPGGENYRELLIRLPELEGPREATPTEQARLSQVEKELADIAELERTDLPEDFSPTRETRKSSLTRELRELQERAPRYTSKHFQDQEIVYLRVDDRTGPNGEKVLFINEVQSDLLQTARKFGFGKEGVAKARAKLDNPLSPEEQTQLEALGRRSNELEQQIARLSRDGMTADSAILDEHHQVFMDLSALNTRRTEAGAAAQKYINTFGEAGAPKVPFSSDTAVEIALKRALLYASENGYDAISWARSDQAAKAVGAEPTDLALQYDKNMGKFLDKYTKKWGGKVEEAGLVGKPSAEGYAAILESRGIDRSVDTTDGVNPLLRITPEMRASVMEGQPLALRNNRAVDVRAAMALRELTRDDDAFVYPKSDKQDLIGIMTDVTEATTFGFEHKSTDNISYHEHGATRIYNFLTNDRNPFHVYEDDGRVWMDVSEVKQGQAGSGIYSAVANYAFNTGRKFIGDPDGMSAIALRRRTENMLSSALKFGTTDHLEPHEDQMAGDEKLGVPPLQWTDGDTLANIASLMEVSVENVASKYPAIKDYSYDFATGTIRTGEGQPVSDEELGDQAKSSAAIRASRAGSRTLARAVLQNSLLKEARGEGGGGLLGAIISRSAQSDQPGALPGRVFYAASREAEALGRTDPYNLVISLAMRAIDAEAAAKGKTPEAEAVRVLRHEAVEFFKATGFFHPKEWQLLERTARQKGWIETTGVRQAYESLYASGMPEADLNRILIKEAIAEQYSEFHLGKKQFTPGITRIFQRVKDYLTRIRNWMKGQGFQTWEDVFTRIDEGEFKRRFEEAFGKPEAAVPTGVAAIQATAGKLADSLARQVSAGTDQPAMTLADIIERFNTALGLTVRQGRIDPGLARAASQAGMKVRGQASRDTGVIRLRVPNEIDTLAHEGGHALENRFKGDLEAIKQQFAAELTPLASPGPDSLSEGFAEWFRRYVTNPAASVRTAPGFETAFEEFLDAQDSTMLASLQEIRAGYQVWISAPSGGAVASSIATTVPPGSTKEFVREFKEGGLRNTFHNWIDRIYTAVFDDLHPIRMTVDGLMQIASRNLKLPKGSVLGLKTANNPYRLLRLARDGYSAGHMDLLHGVHGYKTSTPQGPSLRDALGTAFAGFDKSQWNEAISKDFGAYLTSRRMVQEWLRFQAGELSAPPDKFSLADHQQSIKDFEAKYPGFRQGAQQLYAFQNNMLRKKLDAGLITQDLYDMLSARQDYVPVMRDMSDRGGVEGRSSARKDKFSIISKFRGSQRDVINPLESIAKDAYETAMIIARNDAVRALDALARAAGPDGGKFAERIPAREMKATQVNVQEALKAAAKDAGVDPADMQIMLQAVDDQLGDNAIAQIWRAGDVTEKGEAIIYLWDKGERIPIRLADGQFGHDMLHAISGLNREATDWWINILSLPSTILRTGVTAAPDFIGANFIRDQLSAWVLTRDFVPFVDGAKGIYNDLTMKDVSRIYARAGGIMGGSNVAALHESRVKREVLQLRRKGIRFTLNPFTRDFWRMTEFSETGTRLAVFQRAFDRAKKDGLQDWEATVEAAYTARDYIDFGRRGSRMLAARRLIPFFNAALQGLDREIRGLRGKISEDRILQEAISPYIKSRTGQPLSLVERKNKSRAVRVFAYTALLGVLGIAQSLLYKDDEEYEEISDYIKSTHWVFRDHTGTWRRIPKPFTLATVSNFFERTFDYVYKDDKRAMEKFVSGMFEITVPPHSIPGVVVTTELLANYSFFSGRAIVGNQLKSLPPELQFNAYASEFGKWAGKQMGVSPAYVDHFITGFGASYGREFVNASDRFMPALGRATDGLFGLPKGPVAEQGQQDYFFVRRFTTDPTRGSNSVRQFWDYMSYENGEFIRAANGYKHLVDKVRDSLGAQEFLDGLDEEKRAYALLQMGNKDGRSKLRNLHPLNRAEEIVTITSGIKKEVNLNRLYKDSGKKKDGEQIILSPSEMLTVSTLINDIQMRETRNALIALKVRGWEQRKPIETESVYAELQAAVPEVHEEMTRRLKGKKLPSYEDVVKGWPIARDRILEDGQKAIISDLYSRDYDVGRGERLQ